MENADTSQWSHDFYSSLRKENFWGDEFIYEFNGFWFLLPYLQGTRQVLEEFKPLPTDVILASFPKTGTTWLKSLLYSIVNRNSKQSLITNHPHELVPLLEIQVYGPRVPSSPPPPPCFPAINPSSTRIFNTHIPYQILAKIVNSSDCRVVYVTRNPKDTLVSTWHFWKKWKKAEQEPWLPMEVVQEKFCREVIPYGPFYEHVLGYHKESSERPNKVFFITYEELKSDPRTHVKRLAEFLSCPFGVDEEEEVEEIVRCCSIETLKNHEVNKSTASPNWTPLPYNSFFRQGQVGDHQNYLSAEMIERIDATTLEKFNGSGFDPVAKDWAIKHERS